MSSKAKRQRGKAAAKAPPKKGTKRARDEDKSDKFAESVLASVTCPISHSLVVQPVVAEDGQVYERERIESEHVVREIERLACGAGSSPVSNCRAPPRPESACAHF